MVSFEVAQTFSGSKFPVVRWAHGPGYPTVRPALTLKAVASLLYYTKAVVGEFGYAHCRGARSATTATTGKMG